MRTVSTISALALALSIPALAQTADSVVVPETDIVLVAPDITVDGYERLDITAAPLTVDEIDDADLYSSITGDEIGEVEEVYAEANGAPTYLELEIDGGLFDFDEKEIVVPIDQVSIYRGDDVRVYIAATEEQLNAYPDYDD